MLDAIWGVVQMARQEALQVSGDTATLVAVLA